MSKPKNQIEDWFKIILTRYFGIDFFHIEKKHVNPKDMWVWDWRLLFISLFAIIWIFTINIGYISAGTYGKSVTKVSMVLLIFPVLVLLQKVRKLKNHWSKDNINMLKKNSNIFLIFIILFFIFLYFGSY